MNNIQREKGVDYINIAFHTCGSIEAIGNHTIYTPPSDKRFVITDVLLSFDNDNFARLTEPTNGECKNIAIFKVQTQGNLADNFSHTFKTPYFSDKPGNELRIITTTAAKVYYVVTGYII